MREGIVSGNSDGDVDFLKILFDRSIALAHHLLMAHLKQNSNNLSDLLNAAADALPVLSALVERIGVAAGGAGFVGPLKSSTSIARKVASDYEGDVSRVVDICRATIVVTDGACIPAVLAEIGASVEIVRCKDRFAAPVGGYRDALLNVRINGHICEIQVHVQAILDVKEIIHFAYEYVRVTRCSVAGAWMEIAYDHAFFGRL